MALFTIDEAKCKHDGICVAECPMKIIEMADEKSLPVPTDDAAQKCIQCGHCVAVCPHGAFSHSLLKDEDFPAINKDWILSIEQAEQFLRSRRSIRTYKEKPVEADHLTRLIEIARYAPTGSNSQQVNWLVVNSRDEVTKLTAMVIDLIREMVANEHPMSKRFNLAGFVTAWEQGVDIISRGAPTLIMTYGPKDYNMAQVDCTSALAYFDLAAPTLGLGTCWAGFFMMALTQYQPLIDALGLPDEYGVFGAMMTGYPKFKYKRLVPRKAPNITWK